MLPPDCPLGDRVLVTGGRDYGNWQRVTAVLDELYRRHKITHLIEGEARGADRMAKLWAISRYVELVDMKADWTGHGMSAGSRRNVQMIVRGSPDVVVAFPGDRGTRNMILQTKRFGIPCIDLRYELYGWGGSL